MLVPRKDHTAELQNGSHTCGTADTDEAGKESEGVYVPNELNVKYYSQRASEAGFILAEATQ
jgi:hypothetical protein